MSVDLGEVRPAEAAVMGASGPPERLMTRQRWIEVARILGVAAGIALYARGLMPPWFIWPVIVVGLYPLVRAGIDGLREEHRVGTEVFITFATLIALAGGEAVAGSILMVIILVAEFVADFNTDRARSSIRALIGSVPTVARLRTADGEHVVDISTLRAGDVVLIRAGDRVPVDGVVLAGDGALDESPITGESIPADKGSGASVFAGTILRSGALDVRTERVGAETMFARIIELVEEAEESRAPVQRLADRIAAWLIPLMVVFLVTVFLVTRNVRMVVALMVFTSPAELALATPMVIISGVARAAREGILLKGGTYLESLAHVDTVVFDKTGTLTVGRPHVQSVELFEGPVDEREMLRFAAGADRRSGHPLAEAVVSHAASLGVDPPEPDAFEIVQGRGVIARIEGTRVLVGNAALLQQEGIVVPDLGPARAATAAIVAVDGAVLGVIYLADEVRPGARLAVERLRATGISHIGMLTGDNAATAAEVAREIGIDEVFAGLLPDQKMAAIATLQQAGRKVAMVGDGINDAPALAQADVGIAMGAGGTQAAIEAADVALMTSDLAKIVTARAIARQAYRTIKQNLFFGVGVVHLMGITAALLGLIGPTQAAFIHFGPDVLVFLNSTRLLNMKLHDR